MSRTIEFTHGGRHLEVRMKDVAQTVQVWIFEGGSPLRLHSVISLHHVTAGQELVAMTMKAARSDVETGKLVLPDEQDSSESGTN